MTKIINTSKSTKERYGQIAYAFNFIQSVFLPTVVLQCLSIVFSCHIALYLTVMLIVNIHIQKFDFKAIYVFNTLITVIINLKQTITKYQDTYAWQSWIRLFLDCLPKNCPGLSLSILWVNI